MHEAACADSPKCLSLLMGAATRFAKIKTGLARDLKKPAEVVKQLENEASAGLVNIQNQLNN